MWRELHFTPWEKSALGVEETCYFCVYCQKNLSVSTFASRQIQTAACVSFSLFSFVMIISVPSYKFWATSKASFIITNCCWQRAFWLLRHAGKACMTSCWTFLDAASHSSIGCCTWVAWQLPRLTPFQRGFDRYKRNVFLFTRKTFDNNIYTTKQKLF